MIKALLANVWTSSSSSPYKSLPRKRDPAQQDQQQETETSSLVVIDASGHDEQEDPVTKADKRHEQIRRVVHILAEGRNLDRLLPKSPFAALQPCLMYLYQRTAKNIKHTEERYSIAAQILSDIMVGLADNREGSYQSNHTVQTLAPVVSPVITGQEEEEKDDVWEVNLYATFEALVLGCIAEGQSISSSIGMDVALFNLVHAHGPALVMLLDFYGDTGLFGPQPFTSTPTKTSPLRSAILTPVSSALANRWHERIHPSESTESTEPAEVYHALGIVILPAAIPALLFGLQARGAAETEAKVPATYSSDTPWLLLPKWSIL